MRTPLSKKSQTHTQKLPFWLFLSHTGVCCHADLDSCEQQAPAQKSGKTQAKIACISVFPAKLLARILSRRSQLSRTSRAPSRLSRPSPSDCDAGHDHQSQRSDEEFPGFWPIIFQNTSPKKTLFSCPASSGNVHPTRSP